MRMRYDLPDFKCLGNICTVTVYLSPNKSGFSRHWMQAKKDIVRVRKYEHINLPQILKEIYG